MLGTVDSCGLYKTIIIMKQYLSKKGISCLEAVSQGSTEVAQTFTSASQGGRAHKLCLGECQSCLWKGGCCIQSWISFGQCFASSSVTGSQTGLEQAFFCFIPLAQHWRQIQAEEFGCVHLSQGSELKPGGMHRHPAEPALRAVV